MLRDRILTALVLIPLVVAGVLYLDSLWLAAILGVLVVLGGNEFVRMAKVPSAVIGYAYLAVLVLSLAGFAWYNLFASLYWLQAVVAVWWLAISVWLVLTRTPLTVSGRFRPAVLLGGGVLMLVCWLSVVSLHQLPGRGAALVLVLFVLIWGADSGAYFSGRAFGRRKLSPMVSPGKTWAGVAGALFISLLVGWWLAASGLVQIDSMLPVMGLCLLTTAVSIGGDLWESLIKRQAGVKDSGSLLPGHGGVLDRIDSLIAAAPVFAVALTLLETAA